MTLLPYSKLLKAASTAKFCLFKSSSRNLVSKQLVYTEFGDPLQVVKFRECIVPPLGSLDVLVRMQAAPVNPADINTIQGRTIHLPHLPTVPGDEGVGDVVEIGNKVARLVPGDRVIVTNRLLGTWRYYGIYTEKDLAKVSTKLTLPEASMLTIAPSTAYRLLRDFKIVNHGETVIQNAANSPVGQCIIQFCKTWDIKTINIVAGDCNYECVKDHLLQLGGTSVMRLEEAEELSCFNTSLTRPILALNRLGGRYEDVMLRLLESNGTIVYYGSAYDSVCAKQSKRPDLEFHKFHYANWSDAVDPIERAVMFDRIVKLMVIGKIRAPLYEPVQLKDYIFAFRHTVHDEAFSMKNFIFDFTVNT